MTYKQQKCIPHGSGRLKSKIKAPTCLVSGEKTTSWFTDSAFSQGPCMVDGAREPSGVSYKSTNTLREGFTLKDLIISQRPYLLMPLHWGLGFNTCILGDTNIHLMAFYSLFSSWNTLSPDIPQLIPYSIWVSTQCVTHSE